MFTDSLTRLVRGGVATCLLIFAAACGADGDEPTRLTNASAPRLSMMTSCEATEGDPGGGSEGEILGSLYEYGERACGPFETPVTLVRGTGQSSVADFNSTLYPSPDFDIMWEFWDTHETGPCLPTRLSERPHAPAASVEGHCVRPGWYTYTGPGNGGTRSFEVDYLQWIGSVEDHTSGAIGFGNAAWIARTTSELNMSVAQVLDLVINTELEGTGYTESAALDIDVTDAPNTADFEDQASPTGTATSWFRFNASRSTTSWSAVDDEAGINERGRGLARIYYRNTGGGGWTALTRFFDYNPYGGSGVIRKAQFPGPTSCPGSPRQYDVGVEILRPDENTAAGAPVTASIRTITVTCPASVAAPTVTAASGVGPTSATINWSNGTSTSGVTTEIDTMRSGGSWGNLVSGRPVGSATTYGLTGLTPSTTYSVRVRHDSAGVKSAWDTETSYFTTANVSVNAPTIGTTTSITHNSATINWTNGTISTGVTTRIEYGPGNYNLNVSGIAAGVTSKGLTSLSPSTNYLVRVRHDSGGISSGWSTSSFNTEEADDPPSFWRSTCDRYYTSGKWRITHQLSWSGASGSWQIREAATNDTTAGSVILSGGSGSSAWTGEYLEIYGPLYSYFWIKVGGLAWAPLAENALETTACEA